MSQGGIGPCDFKRIALHFGQVSKGKFVIMLQKMRGKVGGVVVTLFIGLLILSFAVWGIGDIFRSSPDREVVAKVGDQHITVLQAHAELNRKMQQLAAIFGSNFDMNQARSFGLPQIVINDLTRQLLMEVIADEMGLRIGDDAVRKRLFTTPEYKDKSGQFDRSRFKQMLRMLGQSEAQFVERTKHQIAQDLLLKAVANGAQAPRLLAERVHQYDEQKRVAKRTLVPFATQKITEPTAEDLKNYYDEHGESEFMAPAYRDFSVVLMSNKAFAAKIKVSDADVEELYKQNIETYTNEEQRNVVQIVAETEEQAKQAQALLKSGKTLDQIEAAFVVEDPSKTEKSNLEEEKESPVSASDLGMIAKDELDDAVAATAFAANKGEILDPIKADDGWYVVQVTDIKEGFVESLESVRAKLVEEIRTEKAEDEIASLSNKFEDAVAAGQTFAEVVAELKLEVTEYSKLDRTGKGTDKKMSPVDRAIIAAVYDAEVGKETGFAQTTSGETFIAQVNKQYDPVIYPFEEVSAKIKTKLIKERREAAAEEASEKIVQLVRNEKKSLEEAVAAVGLADKPEVTEAFNRKGRGLKKTFPDSLTTALFNAESVGAISSAKDSAGVVVAQLMDVKDVDLKAQADKIKSVQMKLNKEVDKDVEALLLSAMRERFDVKTYPQAMNKYL